jgi:hypothetical protein
MVYSDLYDYSLQTTAVYNRSLQAEYIWFIEATDIKKKLCPPVQQFFDMRESQITTLKVWKNSPTVSSCRCIK